MVVKSTETTRYVVAFTTSCYSGGSVPSIFIGLLLAELIPPLVYFNLAFARVLLRYISTTKMKCKHMKYHKEKQKEKKKGYGAVAGIGARRGLIQRASTVCSFFFCLLG